MIFCFTAMPYINSYRGTLLGYRGLEVLSIQPGPLK